LLAGVFGEFKSRYNITSWEPRQVLELQAAQELHQRAFAQLPEQEQERALLLLLFCHTQQHQGPQSWRPGETSSFWIFP
jgi:hypothetical protein